MIIAVDIETHGLDATKFIMASLVQENGKEMIFYDKNELWNYIIELGIKEQKRKKVLNVYSHNAQYDFYGYADLEDPNLEYYSLRPFIAIYKHKGKKAINFLDSLGIYKMSLKRMGDIVELPKLELPEEFLGMDRISDKRKKVLEKYCINDSKIVMKGIKLIKEKLENDNINIRRLYTINQIAVAYLVNELKKNPDNDNMFFNKDKGQLIHSKYSNEIHEAYRGGRVECFNTGIIENVDYIDINNLYGYSSTKIEFPDLKSERKIMYPLEYFKVKDIINKIGISKVMIYNKKDDIGIIPIRTDTGNYFPKKGKYIIGTYTHIELKEALNNGYEIIDIEYSILWNSNYNPFKEITKHLYELRNKEDKGGFNYWFYKEMQNRSYGKLAQSKTGQEIIVANVEDANEYLNKDYEIIRDIGFNYMYKKDKIQRKRSYYAPIIPTLINAYARVYMYKQFKKVNRNDLIYTDTDSIIMKKGNLKKFKISNDLGKFKVEHSNKDIILWGKKTYAIGDEIKVAGFRKNDITIKEFKDGNIKSKEMVTIKSKNKYNRIGSFVVRKRNLKKQIDDFNEYDRKMEEQKVYIDGSIKNINYFIEKIESIT